MSCFVTSFINYNLGATQLLDSIFRYLKLELLTQFPSLND